MRGEHSVIGNSLSVMVGSSPHARGARRNIPKNKVSGGIIPACAGSTKSSPAFPLRSRDHPPHARGAHRCGLVGDGRRGIIPACAESTPSPERPSCRAWDHPRMRGEHTSVRGCASYDVGSSPHARGAPLFPHRSSPRDGIIPACAGSTVPRPARRGCARDHPRMRGEHALESGMSAEDAGSSPHARGAPSTMLHARLRTGIIPACAGSTDIAFRCGRHERDHPRMRGKHSSVYTWVEDCAGSSPHARGAPVVCADAVVGVGSSPHARGARRAGFLRWRA